MVTTGFFDRFGRPTVEVRVSLASLNLDGMVQFIVDTGAQTLIGYEDAVDLGVDFKQYDQDSAVASVGVGGSLRVYPEDGRLTFRDAGDNHHPFDITLGVAERNPDGWIPSLLGRDILRWFRVVVSEPENEVTLTRPLDWQENR